MQKTFLLSPARAGGQRAKLLFNPAARFDLAQRLHRGESVPLGEIFSFLSGLYFHGKMAYASRFAKDPDRILVITPHQGLLTAATPISLQELAAFSDVDIDAADPRYRRPLEIDLAGLAAQAGPKDLFILLGSLASPKYVGILRATLGARLHFPADFPGRGDMSRGALMLRHAAAEREMEYVPIGRLAGPAARSPSRPKRSAKAAPRRGVGGA